MSAVFIIFLLCVCVFTKPKKLCALNLRSTFFLSFAFPRSYLYAFDTNKTMLSAAKKKKIRIHTYIPMISTNAISGVASSADFSSTMFCHRKKSKFANQSRAFALCLCRTAEWVVWAQVGCGWWVEGRQKTNSTRQVNAARFDFAGDSKTNNKSTFPPHKQSNFHTKHFCNSSNFSRI